MAYKKETDLRYLQMNKNMLAVGARAKKMVTVSCILEMEVITKDNLSITNSKEKDNIITAKNCISVIGNIIRKMEKDVWNGLMVSVIKEIFFMIRCMEVENFLRKTAVFFREIG
jgi:hypothetical protein